MEDLDKFYKEMPLVFPTGLELYHFEGIAIFRPCITINSETTFNSYHFVITGNNVNLPPFIVDNKTYTIGNNRIFPVNPGQLIYSSENKIVSSYIAMFIDRSLISRISMDLYGSEDVQFINGGYRVSKETLDFINMFIFEEKNKQCGYSFMLQSLSIQIIVSLLRHTKNNLQIFQSGRHFIKAENIYRAEDFMQEHFNDDFTINELSKIASLSPYHFIRVFKSQTGKTPYKYLMDLRVEKAVELLRSGKYSMTEVSVLCGFANPSHFSTIFKKKTGISPSDYNKLLP